MKYLILPMFLLSLASAQVVGIPASDSAIVDFIIGLLAGFLVKPLTAIAKKLGRTQGVTTVSISITLSLLAAFGYAFVQAQATNATLSLWQVFWVALIAFLKANGDYISQIAASKKALKEGEP